MIRSRRQPFFRGLLAAGIVAVVVSGCDKGPTRPPIDAAATVGSWVEIVEKVKANPRVAGREEGKNSRFLTVKADNTFEMGFRTPAGKETKDTIEGTWVYQKEDNMLVFEISSSTFSEKDERRYLAPESSFGVRKQNIEGEGLIEVYAISDRDGMMAMFKRGD